MGTVVVSLNFNIIKCFKKDLSGRQYLNVPSTTDVPPKRVSLHRIDLVYRKTFERLLPESILTRQSLRLKLWTGVLGPKKQRESSRAGSITGINTSAPLIEYHLGATLDTIELVPPASWTLTLPKYP